MFNSLVTGGAGFIGAHIVDELITLGQNVVVLDDLSGSTMENVHPQATFVNGSITDDTLVQALFAKHQFQYVYHFAAYAAEGLSHFIRRYNYQNNLIGSINLINASVQYDVACFVFASSIAVYGEQSPPLAETQKPQPEDPYGIAKYAVELDLRNAKRMFGLNSIVFRPHNVYGPKQNISDPYRNVIGIFMNQLLQDQPVTIFGNGKQTRAFTYIGDIATIMAQSVLCKEAYNQAFNIGSDTVTSLNELVILVAEAMKIQPQITFLPAREEVKHAYADHSKYKQTFRPNSDTPIIQGLVKMAQWVNQHGAQQRTTFEDIEIYKNLPPSWNI